MKLYTIIILLSIIYIIYLNKDLLGLSDSKDKIVEKLDIYNYYSQYRLNNYDFNDLNLVKSKRFYPINSNIKDNYSKDGFYTKLNRKKIKYLKAINISFDQIRNEINDNTDIQYMPNNMESDRISKDFNYFRFFVEYLVKRLNSMSSNLYKISFIKILDISGFESNNQINADMIFQLSIKIRKEGLSDTSDSHVFNVKTSFVHNIVNNNRIKNIFIRTLFIDDNIVNDYLAYNV